MSDDLTIEILDDTHRLPREVIEWIASHVEQAARALRASGEVRVRVVGDEAMARAHEEFAGVEGTTDVLTFDMTDPEDARPAKPGLADVCSSNDRVKYGIDTDILVCIDEGNRQASRRGYPLQTELLLYVVHGMLHCLGWDDHDPEEAEAMHRVEDAVLTRIGVGPVYGAGGSE